MTDPMHEAELELKRRVVAGELAPADAWWMLHMHDALHAQDDDVREALLEALERGVVPLCRFVEIDGVELLMTSIAGQDLFAVDLRELDDDEAT